MKLYRDNQNNIHSVSPIQKPKPEWLELTQQEIEEYLSKEPAAFIPSVITKAQGKAALIQAGIYNDVLIVIESLQEPNKTFAKIAFNDANNWRRESEWLNHIAGELGISQSDLDSLFLDADKIEL